MGAKSLEVRRRRLEGMDPTLVADGMAHGQSDQPDMRAYIDDAALAAAGLDTLLEPPVMAAATVFEVTKCELAPQQEGAVTADAMGNRPASAKGQDAGAIEPAQGGPGRSEPA